MSIEKISNHFTEDVFVNRRETCRIAAGEKHEDVSHFSCRLHRQFPLVHAGTQEHLNPLLLAVHAGLAWINCRFIS